MSDRYTIEITKRLDAFKNAREWPDFISLLTQLDSIIQSQTSPFIPKKEYLCKRLNQCLNPLLPAGVHKKAFETYSIIFKSVSKEELIGNFGIYTLGLFNFGLHSRILVMGSYLDLIDKYIINLPVESYSINILYGILPSMESESGEYYKKGLEMVNTLKRNVNEKVFYNSLWNIFLQNSNLRLSIILYLNNDTDSKCDDKYLVVKALKEGLKSTDLLILRNTLDLILCKFPIKNNIFSDSMNSDLLEGMFQIFSRREQSLNKRIFQWIGINDDQEYKPIITKTLSRILRTRSTTHYFFKIFTTLSDKSYLSEKILEDLLFEVLVYTMDYVEKDNAEYPILERNKDLTRQELIDLGKNFFTTDLDRLWKVFYMELKRTFNIAHIDNKIKSIEGYDLNIDENDKIEDVIIKNEDVIIKDKFEDKVIKNEDVIIKDNNSKIDDIIKIPDGIIKNNSKIDDIIKNDKIKDKVNNDKIEDVIIRDKIEDKVNNDKIEDKVIKNENKIDDIIKNENKEEKYTDNIENNNKIDDIIKDNNKIDDIIKDNNKIDDIIKNNNKIDDIINNNNKIDDSIKININDGSVNLEDLKNVTDKEEVVNIDKNNFQYNIENNNVTSTLSNTTLKEEIYIIDKDKMEDITNKVKSKKKKLKIKKIQNESKILKSPSEVLSYINFCISNYNIYDNTVFKTHLPILISFILENYTLLNEEILIVFLTNNINKILMKDQSDVICENFFKLIDDFYTNENAKILKEIQSSYLSLISKYLILNINENNYFLSIEFYLQNKDSFLLDYFNREYYEWMLKRNLQVIEDSLRMDFNNGDLLFKELWGRFIKGNSIKEGTYGAVWNIMNTVVVESTILTNTVIDDTYNLEDKKKIAILIYEYNKLFKRRYEKLLVKKVNEINKQNICLFLHFLLEISHNESYYFYNIFFLINSKISGRDPVLTSLIKSINSYKGIFSYILDKFLDSNIESVNYIYKDKPNISQIKGILKLLKNILFNSRIFRYQIINESENFIINKELDKDNIFNRSTYKNILFDICIFLFLTEQEDNSNDESIRNFKIQCMKIIQFLIENQIINKADILSVDFIKIVDSCKKYKNDPALVIPAGTLINLKDDTTIQLHYSTILDTNCFYYLDLLEVIFKFKDIHIILPIILDTILQSNDINDNFDKEGYSFMIYKEIIRKMVEIKYSFNWASITKSLIQKFILYYSRKQNNLNIVDNDINIINIAEVSEILFNNFSGYFIEYLINSTFSKMYILSLPFRNRLYAEILSSYNINQDKTFKFLMSFDSICTLDQRLSFYNNSSNTLYQITNYRTFTDVYTLLYLLNIYSILDDSSQFLSVIYQSIAHMQRVNINRNDKLLILDFLSRVEFTPKIKSALQTYIGFIFDLLKTSDKIMKNQLIDELIKINNNLTISIKSQLIEYLGSQDFFNFKLKEKASLYSKVDLHVMDELVYKLESSFFASSLSDINNKCNVLKRISFLIFSNEYNKFGGFNSKFIEMCVTLLQHSSVKVRNKAWFLIKILSLKIDHNKLLPLFPVVFSEILIFLNNKNNPDNPEYPSIVKLLDLLFLLNSSATFEFKNTCIKGGLFESIFKDEVDKKLQSVSGMRKLFFNQKHLKSEDIIYFFKYASAYYNKQDKKNSVIDSELLEKCILSEFLDH